MRVSFTIPGQPVPWGRAQIDTRPTKRGGKPRHFTPKRTRDHERRVKALAWEAMTAAKLEPFEGPVALEVWAFFKGEREGEPVDAGPDFDNLGKAVSDALNGVCWKDDRQVSDGTVRKRTSRTPRTEVYVSEVGVKTEFPSLKGGPR